MHAYGYTEETERFPIDYEVFILPYSLLFTSKPQSVCCWRKLSLGSSLSIFVKRSALASRWKYNKAHLNLLYLYRARNKITQLSIPTHAQLRHRLKFIKNHLKTPTCFGLRPSSGSYNVLAEDGRSPKHVGVFRWFLINFNLCRWSCACVGIDNWAHLMCLRNLSEECRVVLYMGHLSVAAV